MKNRYFLLNTFSADKSDINDYYQVLCARWARYGMHEALKLISIIENHRDK